MKNFSINLERLKRHYAVAVKTYDEVSLLDLSHTLRLWVELKTILPAEHPSFANSISFKTASPVKTVVAASRQKQHIYAAFPDGVITYAAKGNLASGVMNNTMDELSVISGVKLKDRGAIEAFYMFAVNKELNDAEKNSVAKGTIKRCNYAQWLSAEAMRVGYLSESSKTESLIISREILMKRMANTLGGSHVAGGSDSVFDCGEKAKRIDKAIQNAMLYEIASLPIPYLILLKIAQDILMIAERKDAK